MLVGLAVLGSVSVGIVGYVNGQTALVEAGNSELRILARARRDLLQQRLSQVESQIDTLATSGGVLSATKDLGEALVFASRAGELAPLLSYFQPVGSSVEERIALSGDGSQSIYGYKHASTHPAMASARANGGYADVYIIDATGAVVYSVSKAGDFALSLSEADLGGLEEGVEAATAAGPDDAVVGDLAPYSFAGGAPSLFVTQQVVAPDGMTLRGFVSIRLDVGFVDAVLSGRDGLGDTGQTYLVRADGVLLSNKPLTAAPTALEERIDDPAMRRSIAGGAESQLRFTALDGVEKLAVAMPVRFGSSQWAIVAERSVSESMGPVFAMRDLMITGTLAIAGLAGLFGILFSRWVTAQVAHLVKVMKALAGGDYSAPALDTSLNTEFGEMARAVEVFRQNALDVVGLTDAERRGQQQRKMDHARMMDSLRIAFGEVVDAARAGDFSRRVHIVFPDVELNQIASSINALMDTVERGLSETGKVLSALARTDLTLRVDGEFQGAFGQLKDDTNAVAEKLGGIVRRMRVTSRGLKTAAGEILSGANHLSDRTNKQAAMIEETSASMEQLASTVQENASLAKEAADVAGAVTRAAEQGGRSMGLATQAMERITASASKIGDIVSLIDDIAFQTNLLALNASVEAARAGEAGEGFAVVAVEVRRLAHSASKASSEIKGLIEKSGGEVSVGSQLVGEAAEELVSMLAASRASSNLMSRIAQQSSEQAASIDQVKTAVGEMDRITQHNAALVEETNGSIGQMQVQAVELDRIVELFRLEGSRTDSSPLSSDPTSKFALIHRGTR